MVDNEITTVRVKPADAELAVYTAGPIDGPLVVLVHGFPELAYSWRHQIRSLADAGYRVIAPDMRGYGDSDKPEDVTDYDIFHLGADIAGLIRHFGGGPAVLVGHDWGAIVAWAFAQFRPDLLAGVAGLSVPFIPQLDVSLIEALSERVGPDEFHYILYFQEPGTADAELDADPLDSLRHTLWQASGDPRIEAPQRPDPGGRQFLAGSVPDGLPDWMTQGDFNAYASAYLRGGFTGPINWYRNLHHNWELMGPWRHAGVAVPAAFIAGRRDPVLTSTLPADVTAMEDHPMLALQAAFCPQVDVTLIDDGGHWIQQEHPNAVTNALVAFMRGLDASA